MQHRREASVLPDGQSSPSVPKHFERLDRDRRDGRGDHHPADADGDREGARQQRYEGPRARSPAQAVGRSCWMYWCTSAIAMLPSPTADATRLTRLRRTSPHAKIPATLVSSR